MVEIEYTFNLYSMVFSKPKGEIKCVRKTDENNRYERNRPDSKRKYSVESLVLDKNNEACSEKPGSYGLKWNKEINKNKEPTF